MVRAIVQGDLNIHHVVASQHAGEHGSLDTLVNSGDILLGNGAANNGVDELVSLPGLGSMRILT